MTPPPPVIVIAGPTAVGKTSLAIELASRIGGEIIGADSRQIYRRLDIGTGKPSSAQRERVPHHLIDIAEPDEVFSAARFSALAAERILRLDATGKRAIVVGGTGLYIRALGTGLFEAPQRDEDLRQRLQGRILAEGSVVLHAELARIDRDAAARIHPNDGVRIVRAIEVWERTGMPISRLQRERTVPPLPGRRFIGIVLAREAVELDEMIRRRVREMAEAGWGDEVRRLLAAGYDQGCPGISSLGYKAMARMVNGEIGPEEAVASIVRETRKYARRQITWFRSQQGMVAVNLTGRRWEETLDEVFRVVREGEQ